MRKQIPEVAINFAQVMDVLCKEEDSFTQVKKPQIDADCCIPRVIDMVKIKSLLGRGGGGGGGGGGSSRRRRERGGRWPCWEERAVSAGEREKGEGGGGDGEKRRRERVGWRGCWVGRVAAVVRGRRNRRVGDRERGGRREGGSGEMEEEKEMKMIKGEGGWSINCSDQFPVCMKHFYHELLQVNEEIEGEIVKAAVKGNCIYYAKDEDGT
ncbi:hypothetical protein TIFTF001_031029 [Ficus carica]|uniref:Uncharacterized protein n=1 Tax=Ficus carica TaxID=3494 RepID=A0AA88DUP3_FICCA|nr:hypothetical protein TIFTF001_031029 [Ficus carica]